MTNHAIANGTLVLIVGASGVGKDTLMRRAHEVLASDQRFVFAQRHITRPPDRFEDHCDVTTEEFEHRAMQGYFALSWKAHNLSYGVPRATVDQIGNGKVVICNVSRLVVGSARKINNNVFVIEIVASDATRSLRLRARGRETADQVTDRLNREVAQVAQDKPDLLVDNSGPIETGLAVLLSALRSISLYATATTGSAVIHNGEDRGEALGDHLPRELSAARTE
jgi:ribose 1,5-bisphosphokinase